MPLSSYLLQCWMRYIVLLLLLFILLALGGKGAPLRSQINTHGDVLFLMNALH